MDWARFVRAWGNLGAQVGQFDEPKGIAVAPNGDIYVADDRNDRIQRFSVVQPKQKKRKNKKKKRKNGT